VKRFLTFTKGNRLAAILGPLLKLCEATLELIVPLIIANIIDTGIKDADGWYIARQCLILLLLGAVGFAFSVIAQYFCARCAVGSVTKMRYSLFAHLQTLSYTEIDRLGTATMITRMSADANQVQTGLNLALRLLLRSPFVVFGAMIMAYIVEPTSALTFGVTIAVLSVIVFGIMLISMPMYKKTQKRLDGVVLKTRENLSGARVIRAFCKEESEIDEFKEKNGALSKMQIIVGRISALMNPMTFAVINSAIIVLLYTGAIDVSFGSISSGEVVALYNYMSQILVELIKLANLIITITKALASLARINSVFDIKSSMQDGYVTEGAGAEVILAFENAALKYDGAGDESLSGLNFSVNRGQTLGVIGGTGSGKTSLVNLIPRFYDATDGEVYFDGVNVKDYSISHLRRKIGIVPQKSVLFAGTVRDNMKVGNNNATDEEIFRALKIAQAEDFVLEKGGLDAMIEQGGKNLSGGQRQRLAIARAVVRAPELLILDDSASALDFATDAALRAALKSLVNTTMVIVSQRASSIMHADKIVVLDDGVPDAVGTHEELLNSSVVYREIYASQFEEVV